MSKLPCCRLLLLFPAIAGNLRGETLAFDRPEAWAMKYFGAVSVMQGNGAPRNLGKGEWALGFEIANIPHLDKEQQTVGFNGTKEEDLNKAPVLARPLLHYGISDRLSLTGTYMPPVEIFDGLRTHLAGVSVNYWFPVGNRITVGLRLSGQFSQAKGDFTAPAEVVGNPDPEVNPFEAIEPSRDVYTSWTGAGEVAVTFQPVADRGIFLFLNTSWVYGDYDFDVFVQQPEDNVHTNRLYADGAIWVYGGGVELYLGEKLSLRLAAVLAPLKVRRPPDYARSSDDLLNFRLVLNYKL